MFYKDLPDNSTEDVLEEFRSSTGSNTKARRITLFQQKHWTYFLSCNVRDMM